MRLFVALRLDEMLRGFLAQLQSELRRQDTGSDVRWVAPDGLHLTLRFLGDVEPGRLPGLRARLGEAVRPHEAPCLGLAGLGGFPNLERPRVLWARLSGDGEVLGALRAAIETAVLDLGWAPEKRAFQPHLTLGRVREITRGRPRRLGDPLREALALDLGSDRPPRPQTTVCLIRSRLSRNGARYEDLETWTLKRSGDAGSQGAR